MPGDDHCLFRALSTGLPASFQIGGPSDVQWMRNTLMDWLQHNHDVTVGVGDMTLTDLVGLEHGDGSVESYCELMTGSDRAWGGTV